MGSRELLDQLFGAAGIQNKITNIAEELANRDLFPLIDFPRFLDSQPTQDLTKECSAFYEEVRDIVLSGDNLQKLSTTDKRTTWLNMAVWMSHPESDYDINSLAMYLCIYLIAEKRVTLDEHVESLRDTKMLRHLGLNTDDEMLTSLSDPRLELKRRAIIIDGTMAVFPHEFMRRYYTSNFVDLPILLAKAKASGLDVSIRIDPRRKTAAKNYTKEGLFEADYWHGPPFSRSLLEDKKENSRTQHRSTGVINMSYDARYTIFRTKMMDANLREFSIEEYCPLELPSGDTSSAWGDKYYIQKFGHLVYDQKTKRFEHVDGAVRVFIADDYEEHFNKIQQGSDIDEKVGKREKMFLVKRKDGEPGFNLDVAQELLTEWFRYNPHIQEYFSGTKAEAYITYERLAEIRQRRKAEVIYPI